MTDWIKTADELPPEGEAVFVWNSKYPKSIHVASMSWEQLEDQPYMGYMWQILDIASADDYEFDYWRPMIKPPQIE